MHKDGCIPVRARADGCVRFGQWVEGSEFRAPLSNPVAMLVGRDGLPVRASKMRIAQDAQFLLAREQVADISVGDIGDLPAEPAG